MTLDENDYLTYHLYTASNTPRIKAARIRGWILTPVVFLCLSYLFFESTNYVLGYYFVGMAILSILLYPLYFKWRYKRHYKKVILDTYKNRFGEECSIEITDVIRTKDSTGEVKILTSQVEEIDEIASFYFVKIKTGGAIIISKLKTDPVELNVLVNKLMRLVEQNGIRHNKQLNWKW